MLLPDRDEQDENDLKKKPSANNMRWFRIMSGPYNLNTYILACDSTQKAVVIDPGGPAEDLAAWLKERFLDVESVLMTHGHADQFFSMTQFKKIFPVPYCLHQQDDEFFRDTRVREKTRKAVGLPPPYPADILLKHGDLTAFGSNRIKVIHTPGHTPGSCCFLCGDRLFTGDAVFVGEAGRTDLPGGNLDRLIDSIRDRILPLGEHIHIHPGHHHKGMPVSSTIGQEMKTNIYITDFILDP